MKQEPTDNNLIAEAAPPSVPEITEYRQDPFSCLKSDGEFSFGATQLFLTSVFLLGSLYLFILSFTKY